MKEFKKGDLLVYTGRDLLAYTGRGKALKRGEMYEFVSYGDDDNLFIEVKDADNNMYPVNDFKLIREAKVKRLLDEIDEL